MSSLDNLASNLGLLDGRPVGSKSQNSENNTNKSRLVYDSVTKKFVKREVTVKQESNVSQGMNQI